MEICSDNCSKYNRQIIEQAMNVEICNDNCSKYNRQIIEQAMNAKATQIIVFTNLSATGIRFFWQNKNFDFCLHTL